MELVSIKNSFLFRYCGEKKKMLDGRRVKEYNSVKFDEKQEQEIQTFFLENYGKKIDTRWHRMYQSFTGNYDKKYFPEILFSSQLEFTLNDRKKVGVFADKAMVELLYKGIDGLYIPRTELLCCSGIYYDTNRNIISKDRAKEILNDCGKKIIKKTVGSSSGRGVLIIDVKNGLDVKNNISAEDILNEFGENFIIQELITNSEDIRKIYDKSLNTFRVMTYTVNGRMYHVPLAMRIGQAGKEVDNIHAGGMFIGVNDDGILIDTAFTEFQTRYKEHPDSKLKFEGYKINGIEEMIEIAYKCHGRTPHLGIISWDFTINDKNQVTLIEVNLNSQSIWFPQMANGKAAFGDNTEYMLNLIRKK